MVGIITLNSAREYNYGCLLQNYALKYYLNKQGIPTDAIYCSSFSFLGACRSFVYKSLHMDIRRHGKILYFIDTAERKRNTICTAFVKNQIQPRQYSWFGKRTHKAIDSNYSKVIVGSDQVWNPEWAVHDKSASTYLLTFLPPEKRISYAASFGVTQLPEFQKRRYKEALNGFKSVSVREDAGKDIVEELTDRKDVQVLIDPTLLLSKEDWDKITAAPDDLPDNFILTYFLGEISEQRKSAIQMKAKQMGCQVINMMDKSSPFYCAGPERFLYLVKHAALVCTDSFHASVFSFLYERPLAILRRDNAAGDMSSRIDTLVSKFSLQDCLVTEQTLLRHHEAVDYKKGLAALEIEREKAKVFLKIALE